MIALRMNQVNDCDRVSEGIFQSQGVLNNRISA
jgi:hypothetical protein